MKRISHLLLSAALLFSFACTRDGSGVSPDEGNPDGHKVSVEAALADLQTVLGQIDGQTRGGSSRSVASVCAVKAADMLSATRSGELPDVEDLVYIANFENGEGYAILGADDRLESVIAVTEQGSLTPEELAAAANGNYDEETMPPLLPEIAAYASGAIPYFVEHPDKIVYGMWSKMFISYTPSLLPMKWGQGAPYNYYVQQHHGDCPVGCTAVALGQIIALMDYRYGINHVSYIGGRDIDWSGVVGSVINSFDGDRYYENVSKDELNLYMLSVANFLYGIALAIDTDFTHSGSFATANHARDLLIDLGFKNVSLSDYDENLIFSRIYNSDMPVWMRGENSKGSGHAWVLDGVVKQFRSVQKYRAGTLLSDETEYRNLFHCNFGYLGIGDGYYITALFTMKAGPVIQDQNQGDRSGIYTDEYNFLNGYKIITFTGI